MVLTLVGMEEIRKLIMGESSTHLNTTNTHTAAGRDDGTILPIADTNTALGDEINRSLADTVSQPSDITFFINSEFINGLNSVLGEMVAGEVIQEIGIFNSSSGVLMFTRQEIVDFTKSSLIDINFETTIEVEIGT